jgi:hypothetical protein
LIEIYQKMGIIKLGNTFHADYWFYLLAETSNISVDEFMPEGSLVF